jgi:replicative DNA helicase
MRDKWDRRQSGTTYGAITIQKAIDTCQEVYTPPQERPQAPQGAEKAGQGENPTPGQKTPQEAPQPRKTALQLFDEFMGKVQTEAYKPLQTGMPAFDRLLGGGIVRQALVILTAAPGTGKTALASQVFEEMAKQGADVIFLNLEMSREQLLARSVSRICHRQGHKGISAADVLKGYSWDDTRRAYIQEAADEYRRTIAERMQYNPEGTGTNLDSIMNVLNAAGEAAKQAGKPAPVVILDYLHLITTDKREEQAEILKKAVAALKGYAIRYDTFVFAISANNRAANTSGIVSLDSGRDTSAIEYSADIQLSLNYAALADRRKKDNGEYYKASNPDDMAELQRGDANGNREMIVQVLKNRLNTPGGKLYMSFNPAASVFYPVDKYATPPAYYKGGFTPIDDEDPDNPFI